MQVVSRKIAELKHPSYNPRVIKDADFEQLKRSLKEFGAVDPAIINMSRGREGIIIGGNQRVEAAKSLGWKDFPVVELSLNEVKERELNIRLNRGGDWDFDLLEEQFKQKDLIDWGFEPFLFNTDAPLPDVEKEYTGMPEYSQESIEGALRVVVNFKTEQDYAEFVRLLGYKKIRTGQKLLWFPELGDQDQHNRDYRMLSATTVVKRRLLKKI